MIFEEIEVKTVIIAGDLLARAIVCQTSDSS